MQDRVQKFMDDIRTADMILVGLGEEFDDLRNIRSAEGYVTGKEMLADSEQSFLIPMWQRLYREDLPEETEKFRRALQNLADCLAGKNYFIVSVSTNCEIAQFPWREGRLVMPCGTDLRYQCKSSCENHLQLIQSGKQESIKAKLLEWRATGFQKREAIARNVMDACPVCGTKLELNNIYNNNYDENGYLPDWQIYTKWLQGTLNKRIVVLELGVGMSFPSVIRFPFEKVVYFNQMAKFYRIHETLYQLTEELAEKGCGIAKNAIDWLQNLC